MFTAVTRTPSKQALVDELVELLRADLAAAEQLQRQTVAGATHEEARPENDKDTRALEQSYLARGQAQRVEQLRLELAEVLAMPVRALGEGARVSLGAFVAVEEDGGALTLFIAAARGGTELGGGVHVVTPSSPLGRGLLGKVAGDLCEIRLPQRVREIAITSVS
jgi:transcription elongation GreA/GreB family factor